MSQSWSVEALMFFPSSRLRDRMLIDEGGVWTECDRDGDLHLVVKAPMHAIRAIHCFEPQISLRVAVLEFSGAQLLVFAIRIEDEPGCPNTSFGPLRDERDLEELLGLLTLAQVRVHFFNELLMNLLCADCRLPPEVQALRSRLQTCVPSLTPLASVPRKTIDTIMDHFQAIEGGHAGSPDVKVHVVETLSLTRAEMTELEVVYLGAGRFKLSDLDEGGELERLVYPLFEWLCPGQAYLSPQVGEGSKARELTDLLAFTPVPEGADEGYFVVESKALSVANAKKNKSSDRRGKSVQKDIRKAIRQVVGAAKAIHKGTPIRKGAGEPIVLGDRAKAVGHGLVLLSEMHSQVDWVEVAQLAEEARGALLVHVLDLVELQKLMTQSEGRASVFESFLIQRWEAVFKHRTLLRTRVIRPGVDP